MRAGRQRNWKTGRKRNRQRGVEKKEPSKDRRGRKEKGAKGQEEAAEGFPKLRTLPRELRGAPWLPNITPGSWSSTVHLSCWRRHPPLRAPSRQLPLPVFHPPVVQGTPFLSLTPRSLPLSLFSFPVPSYLSPPCTLLASELQAASPTTTLTIIVLNRPPHPQERGEKEGGTATNLDPLSPHFLHSGPFPKRRVQNGDSAQPREPLQSAEASGSGCHLASLFSALAFCTWRPRPRYVLFSSFYWYYFFPCCFSFFFGLGTTAEKRPPPGLLRQLPAVGSFSSLRSCLLAPFSSVSARSCVLSAPSSASSPYCLSSTPLLSPSVLPLLPFCSPSSPPLCPHFFPTFPPTHTLISLLWFPLCH